MGFLRKYQFGILIASILFLLYLLTRLSFLTNLPIFTDEAIYIRWAQIALHDANWRFISLTDGKQPLFIWIMMFYLKVIHDPIIAGRLVSVTAGIFACIGLWLLSVELYKNRMVGWVVVALYIAFPLALLHDRMAIYDSLVATIYVFALYFSVLLVRKRSLLASYNLGFILGAGVLNKSGGFLSMALLPFTLLLFDFKQKESQKKLYYLVFYGCIAIGIGFVMYNILRLSPFFGMIDQKNAVFVYPLKEWAAQSWELRWLHFLSNMQGVVGWFSLYMSILYLVFLCIGFAKKESWRQNLLLLVFFLLPFLYLAMFGKVLFPRFILFMSVILLPVIAFGVVSTAEELSRKIKRYSIVPFILFLTFLTVLPNSFSDYFIITDPLHAPISFVDKAQYVGNWPSGWGVKETISYLQQQAQSQKIYIATEGTFGLMPFALEMYLGNNPNITIEGYWPIEEKIPSLLLQKAKKEPTYMYFYQPCQNCPYTGIAPKSWPVVPIFTVSKNDNQVHATLYQIQQ